MPGQGGGIIIFTDTINVSFSAISPTLTIGGVVVLNTTSYTAVSHDIWNRLDEYGLILGVSRVPGESNKSYQSRLSKYVSQSVNATLQGVINSVNTFFGITPYVATGVVRFILTYKPLSITKCTVNGILQIERDDTNWDTFTDGFIVWKEHDGSFSIFMELKQEPVAGVSIEISYRTLDIDPIKNTNLQVVDNFIGIASESPSDSQIEVQEFTSEVFIKSMTELSGDIKPEYFSFINAINGETPQRNWGSFRWDDFYWDENTKLNNLATHYDAKTSPDSVKYNSGVAHGDDLKLLDITEDNIALIKPGYFFVGGFEYYLYSYKITNHVEPFPASEYTPLEIFYKDEINANVSKNVHPVLNTPVIIRKESPTALNIGYSGDKIEPTSSLTISGSGGLSNVGRLYSYPVQTTMLKLTTINSTHGDAHEHQFRFNSNIGDAANKNGWTDPGGSDNHVHEIITGNIQSVASHTHTVPTLPSNYGYYEPTPDIIRKRQIAPSVNIIPDDTDYFLLKPELETTGVKIEPDKDSDYLVEFELGRGNHKLYEGPALNPDTALISRTFLGIGTELVPFSVKVYISKSAIHLGQKFGVSVVVLDEDGARFEGASVNLTMDNSVKLNGPGMPLIGHTYSDGTAYSPMVMTDSGSLNNGDTFIITAVVEFPPTTRITGQATVRFEV